MRKAEFTSYLEADNFYELFLELGWNNPQGDRQLAMLTIDDVNYDFSVVVERNGFKVLSCPVEEIPKASTCKKIDTKLRRYANDYICIFFIPQTMHQLWVVPVNKVEKRDLVVVEYDSPEKAEFLFEKIDGFSFDLDEVTTIVDVKERVQGAFAVNSEKVTKKFYDEFKKQHTAFTKFISGINDEIADKDNKDKQWYTSVMLNRLMFCYFIQKKGFLNNDVDYLKNKLHDVQEAEGRDSFYDFYRSFLIVLFHDGLNAPKHDATFVAKFGRIPYLNGGMFDYHELEHKYPDINIKDEAFERLFNFFDEWQWHLDTRLTASGKDINPDVLGYIFEQYINDRAQMGAYYTKEDITEYIGRNTIVPFLLDKVKESQPKAFATNGEVWRYMQEQEAGTYVYDAVQKGYSDDWHSRIPAKIAKGLDTTKPNLLERRSHWNEKTDEKLALPTEIWRETLERLQRCEDIEHKIKNGEIHEVNDFITYNLNLRKFVEDFLRQTSDHKFVGAFYHALQNITILDPTCGSGAFLFAALNILEPLYDVCIDRMEEFHSQNEYLFKNELAEISNKYRSNRQYFIYKSIILRNLYGVDIMVEATEIAKLRLFLKLVAVVDVDKHAPNLGLDPLPDVDFNIRCGNTLVGYACQKEIDNALVDKGMFAQLEFNEKVNNLLQVVSKTYDTFKWLQINQDDDRSAYKEAKQQLKAKLVELEDLLNHLMFGGKVNNWQYQQWLHNTQPYHWYAEYYEIMSKGGFDVIIGNPPYVQYFTKDRKTGKSISDIYTLLSTDYDTLSCGDLYSYCVERAIKDLRNANNRIGMIVPISIVSTDGYSSLRKVLTMGLKGCYFSNFGVRPSKLFDGVDKRLTIFINSSEQVYYNTKYTRWNTEERDNIFNKLNYERVNMDFIHISGFPKISTDIELSILNKLSKPQFRNPTNSLRSLRSKPPRMRFLLFKQAFCHILTDMSA